jgi:hypothetical protein
LPGLSDVGTPAAEEGSTGEEAVGELQLMTPKERTPRASTFRRFVMVGHLQSRD